MTPKKKAVRGRTRKKAVTRAKPAKRAKFSAATKKVETKNVELSMPIKQVVRVESPSRESVKITVESIQGETAIGDLLVAFPHTREVLVRNGLRLEAEDAGDIYMTLDAFSALNGIKAEILVQDLIGIAKGPPPQQAGPQLASPPTA